MRYSLFLEGGTWDWIVLVHYHYLYFLTLNDAIFYTECECMLDHGFHFAACKHFYFTFSLLGQLPWRLSAKDSFNGTVHRNDAGRIHNYLFLVGPQQRFHRKLQVEKR